MGGLGPGIGGFEILVIGLVALLVVGPKDLPVMMRKLGQAMARARAMANEFRASFDEMARQSELDELRREVDALRRTQMMPLGAETEATFREINADLNRPAKAPSLEPRAKLPAPEPSADAGASGVGSVPAPGAGRKPRAKPAAAIKTKAAPAKTAASKTPAAKPKVRRKKAVDL